MTITATEPAVEQHHARLALARVLTSYVLLSLPGDYAYSSGALNMLVRALLDGVDATLAEHFAAMDLEEDD